MAQVTRLGLYGGPRTPYGGFVAAGAVVTLSAGFTETQIVTGGQSIVFTLVNDTWDATLGADNAVTTAFINSLDSGGAETFGWDAVVKVGLTFSDVTRDSDTQVTVLLPAFPTYDITADETITANLDASVFTTSVVDVLATPTFDVTNVTSGASAGVGRRGRRSRRLVKLPDGRISLADDAEIARLLNFYKVPQEVLEAKFEEKPTRRQMRKIKDMAVAAPEIIAELEEDEDIQFVLKEVAKLLQ